MQVSKIIVAAGALAATALTTLPASADEIDRRQANQISRIQQGVRDGSLTRNEANRLIEEQKRIAEMERRAERDGRIDRNEKAAIDRAQDNASQHIRQERHDAESRGSGRRWGWGWGRGHNHHADNDHRPHRPWFRRWW